ncbi:MAG: D-cysteine desulfhydrase family protein [Planctomycetales bacterium]|nr:D-cysteine desulfhydrase family protein [Planctomycetales bacterium]
MDLPDKLASWPRVPLANTPTPLHPAPRLTEALGGPRVLLKRDDLTGLATGGNKTRKLEFLLADALAAGADCLITAGGPQSNHCRQTAAAAAKTGLRCCLVLGGEPPARCEGNLLLDRLLGAELHWVEKPRRKEAMQQLAEQLAGEGHTPYVIPIGGSNAVGALGYVVAMYELAAQLRQFEEQVDCVVAATSSGGTLAGMVAGARLCGFQGQVLAISIDQQPEADGTFAYRDAVRDIANESCELLGSSGGITDSDIHINHDYLGGGYGVVGQPEREAVRLMAETEGVLVGPVYTSRALAGLIDLARRGTWAPDQTVVFWHTGDETALHAYGDEFLTD